eukprot:scaffold7963_cov34-Tisochrysis_lutea.AAC.1
MFDRPSRGAEEARSGHRHRHRPPLPLPCWHSRPPAASTLHAAAVCLSPVDRGEEGLRHEVRGLPTCN